MGNPLKKTMVFLGLAEEEFDEISQDQPKEEQPKAERQAQQQKAAPVTPLRKVTPTRAPAATPMNEILTVHPTEYRDAQMIAENFRDGIPVILNLSRMNDAEAKRLIDFSSGLAMGLEGKIERVTSKVFLLSPEHIAISGEAEAAAPEPASGSFFVAPN